MGSGPIPCQPSYFHSAADDPFTMDSLQPLLLFQDPTNCLPDRDVDSSDQFSHPSTRSQVFLSPFNVQCSRFDELSDCSTFLITTLADLRSSRLPARPQRTNHIHSPFRDLMSGPPRRNIIPAVVPGSSLSPSWSQYIPCRYSRIL